MTLNLESEQEDHKRTNSEKLDLQEKMKNLSSVAKNAQVSELIPYTYMRRKPEKTLQILLYFF